MIGTTFATFSLVAMLLHLSSGMINYCDQSKKLCNFTGYHHITCDSNGSFSSSCPNKARVVSIESHIQQILDEHNKKRNELAGGKIYGFNSAARMPTMQWNHNLAELAELNVRRCRYGHDCHNTPETPNSGQNINFEVGTGLGPEYEPVELFIEDTIDSWWNQKNLAKHSDIDRCCGSSQISHFLQMASDKVDRVGCAIIQYTESEEKKTNLVCNYSVGLDVHQRVYSSGGSATRCTSGRNRKYLNLCSKNEQIKLK